MWSSSSCRRPTAPSPTRWVADWPRCPRVPRPRNSNRIRRDILGALAKPSTKARIRSAMWKTYAHARKKGRLEGVDLHDLRADSPEVRLNVDELARELTRMERISFENDLLFGTSPVIARDRRRVAAAGASSG